MKLTAQQWGIVLGACGVKPALSQLWAPIFAATINDSSFSKGPAELPDFLGNILHESGKLSRMVENLNYSEARIKELAATAKSGSRWWRAGQSAEQLAGNPQALAEVLYGGRFGNVQPGDGWLYRGRSPVMITFLDNYKRVGDLAGQDLVHVPDLAAQPQFALEITLAWWEDKVPDEYIGNDALVRRCVQGGRLGLAEVSALSSTAADTLRELNHA